MIILFSSRWRWCSPLAWKQRCQQLRPKILENPEKIKLTSKNPADLKKSQWTQNGLRKPFFTAVFVEKIPRAGPKSGIFRINPCCWPRRLGVLRILKKFTSHCLFFSLPFFLFFVPNSFIFAVRVANGPGNKFHGRNPSMYGEGSNSFSIINFKDILTSDLPSLTPSHFFNQIYCGGPAAVYDLSCLTDGMHVGGKSVRREQL